MKLKKSQGEIFGVALMFVLIVIGILVYSQVKALDPQRGESSRTEDEYKLLSETSLVTILQTSTGCYVERDEDTVKDLIDACLENSFTNYDPTISCLNGEDIKPCSRSVEMLETTLYRLFNKTEENDALIGGIPFRLKVDVPDAADRTMIKNITITNFGDFTYRGDKVEESSYRSFGYSKATPDDPITWATSQREILITLALYYRG